MLSIKRYTIGMVLSLILFLFLMFTYETMWMKQLDFHVLHTIFDWRIDLLTPCMIFITIVGSWHVTAPIWFVLLIFLLYKRQAAAALFITLVFWGGRGLNWLLKEIFQRPRPEWSQLVDASHYSFPSGHAMNSSAFYIGILLLVLTYAKSRLLKVISLILFCMLIVLIGFSRMYLGVHYLTDILAGYAVGFAWAISMYQLYDTIAKPFLERLIQR
ncbi:phosphatase PAP2 family protein [Priestia megaterium]|nr:phosphatase PAP2 family protein [Priestia megaterium]